MRAERGGTSAPLPSVFPGFLHISVTRTFTFPSLSKLAAAGNNCCLGGCERVADVGLRACARESGCLAHSLGSFLLRKFQQVRELLVLCCGTTCCSSGRSSHPVV